VLSYQSKKNPVRKIIIKLTKKINANRPTRRQQQNDFGQSVRQPIRPESKVNDFKNTNLWTETKEEETEEDEAMHTAKRAFVIKCANFFFIGYFK
jgi:hypothetical protein